MNQDNVKRKIFAFLNTCELTVLSTVHVDKEGTESAIVGFGNNEALEIIFGTSNRTRKYKNLQADPHVSLVIGFSSETGYIQYEGTAKELSAEEAKEYNAFLVKKNESHAIKIAEEDHRTFKIIPTWIRFFDNAGTPPEVHELNF